MSLRPITDEEREELTSYLDGEVDATLRKKIEAQLSSDPALRTELDAMKRTWALLDQLPRPEPAQDFTNRTLSRIRAISVAESQTDIPSIWKRIAWKQVAAIAAIFAIGWLTASAWQRREPRSLRADDPVLVRDLRLIENLPYYDSIETIEFLTGLDQPERFGTEAIGP